MKGVILAITLTTLISSGFGQDLRYRIVFKDKNMNPYTLERPLDFLSPAALERRERMSVALDSLDLPISPVYVDSIRRKGGLIQSKSKWLNSCIAKFADSNAANACLAFPFVESIELVESASGKTTVGLDKFGWLNEIEIPAPTDTAEYQYAFNQINMLNGTILHSMGYRGEGIKIAVLDAGFTAVDIMDTYKKHFEENRMHPVWNFISSDTNVFQMSQHGTLCLSTMAASNYQSMTGTAPNADYYLFVSEESAQENPVEEDYWAAAAEKADSIGVHIITSSLGYNTYDDAGMDHSYSDMDGHTTVAARAANIAYNRGILVLASAGNEGDKSWHYIGTPADADSVLAVGAVDYAEKIAAFSSRGPSADGDVKPNICAKGKDATVLNTADLRLYGSGTSFACPIAAGMAACLIQALPEKNHRQFRAAIQNSADRYLSPDEDYGYGIPDFYTAYYLLKANLNQLPEDIDRRIQIFPNPFTESFNFSFYTIENGEHQIELVDQNGKQFFKRILYLNEGKNYLFDTGYFEALPAGQYFLYIQSNEDRRCTSLMKW